MNRQKKQTKIERHIQFDQANLILSKCKQGRTLCISAYKEVADISLAFLLYRLCRCYEEIMTLLNNDKQQELATELDVLKWVPGKRFKEYSDNLPSEKLGPLLMRQQELLYQLRMTIALMENRDLAFELSGSVANFQILHDHLVQFQARFTS